MPFVTLGVGSHAALTNVTATDHHTATVAGDLDHQDLANRGAANHHADLPGLASSTNQTLVVNSSLDFIVAPQMTQAITEAGVSGEIRGYSALRVAQAIAAQAPDKADGTWTPTIKFGGNQVDMTFTTQLGEFVRIGKLMHIAFIIVLSAKGSSTGDVTIEGLPTNLSGENPGLSIALLKNVTFANQAFGRGGTSAIDLLETTEAGANTALTEGNFADTSEVHGSMEYEVG